MYYQLNKITTVKAYANVKNPDSVYENIYVLDQNGIKNKRVEYNFLDFINDIAGIYDLLLLCAGYFLSDYAFHSFTVKAIKKLFLIKTDDYHIFDEKY